MREERSYQVLAVLLIGFALLGSGCELAEMLGQTPKVARLVAVAGPVKIEHDRVAVPATANMGLYEDDVVITPVDGGATIEFQTGNVVALGSAASLVLGGTVGGGTSVRIGGAQLEGVQSGGALISGTASAKSSGGGARFAIGTPFGLAVLGAEAGEVSINVESGIKVTFGAVEVTAADGHVETLEQGEIVNAQGLVVKLDKHPSEEPDFIARTAEVLLTGNTKGIRIKFDGQATWHTPGKREKLKPGDAVKTLKTDTTRLQIDEFASVALRPDTEILIEQSQTTAKATRSRYRLGAGSASFQSTRLANGASHMQEVVVAGMTVAIEVGLHAADVEITEIDSNRAQVAVRMGRAHLEAGQIVEAGNRVDIDRQAGPSSVRPIAASNIAVHAGYSSTIYYSNGIPPVRFVRNGEESKPPFTIEMARDKAFRDVVFQEQVTSNGFVYDSLKAGTWFWRVRMGDQWQDGTLSVETDAGGDCARCKRQNVLDDTGEATTLFFRRLFRRLPFAGVKPMALRSTS